jgi:replication-associated recombination protein RarA
LPDALAGAEFYHPTDRGWEKRIAERLQEIGNIRKSTDDSTPK